MSHLARYNKKDDKPGKDLSPFCMCSGFNNTTAYKKMRGERIQINEKLLQYIVYKGCVSKLCLFSDVFMKIINKTL